MVGWNTYVDYRSLYSKAIALAWIYKLRVNENHSIVKNRLFHANNVAFRKELIMAHPFPEMPEGVIRMSCVMLSKELELQGITVWINTAAQVSHPAPNGIHNFFLKALVEGRDFVFCEKLDPPIFLKGSYFEKFIARMLRIFRDRKKVDLPVWQTPFALGIMLSYYMVTLTGSIIARVYPSYAKSSWQSQ